MNEDKTTSGDRLRQEVATFLHFRVPALPATYTVHEEAEAEGYTRARISYTGDEGEQIPAYLLLPETGHPGGAVVVHHQHHGQRHLGKSEVAGLAGDPLQALGPALARQGVAVLAPDSICFEDRRRGPGGTVPRDGDETQHYNEMCARLLRGDTLMRKVLSDSAQALSVLRAHPRVEPARVGIVGHSYGGTTALFHGALDERIAFGCASGAAASFAYRLARGAGIELASVIPGFVARYELADLVACFAPRPLLLLSATADPHAADADQIVAAVRARRPGGAAWLAHRRYEGGHALTRRRLADLVGWVARQANGAPDTLRKKTSEDRSGGPGGAPTV